MNWVINFPFEVPFDTTVIDNIVNDISIKYDSVFTVIKDGLNGIISAVQFLLGIIPWWAYLILVFLVGWKIGKKFVKGIIYTFLMLLIGAFGLWDLMIETLSIVLASVLISLILGLPIGIFVSKRDNVDKFIRPLLDAMQTMPIFVYLIPAIIFFGLGKAPAVLATVIYSIVPVIRLSNHGIRQVDIEVIEAAKAFGSTNTQTLFKVQIPQALPTIMTGVNQTLMMAMSMVVTCSMIGANGLGMEVLIGVNRMEMGRGLVSGMAVVIIAIILDRFTQGLTKTGKGGA